MEQIRQIWFDFAGTLYRETPEFNAVHDQLRYSTYAKAKNISDIETAKLEFLEAYKKYGSNSAVFRALGKPADYWSHALDEMDFTAVLSPDHKVTKTIITLKENVTLGLFTNFIKSRSVELLEHLEIPPSYFTYMVTGDEIVERKPALDGFRKMISKSGVSAEQILYVGDRVDVDIKPAKKLGIKTCLIYGKSDEADYSCDNFSDLLKLFK